MNKPNAFEWSAVALSKHLLHDGEIKIFKLTGHVYALWTTVTIIDAYTNSM